MNFFEAQDKARRNTGWLVILFLFAVAGLIILTNIFVLGVIAYANTGIFVFSLSELTSYFDLHIFIGVGTGIALLVLLASLYKVLTLSSGGSAVAEMLGGKLVPRSSQHPKQKMLLNVIEEMAIASGTPIPKVYLLDEMSINAFAAGKSPATAVIGITHGALSQLSRDELQGVIAHEFSHIFNGDMRLNIRLMGLLHGILIIGIIGYYILRSLRHVRVSRSRNEKGGGAIAAVLALGVGLMVIGYAGTFFGQWIKAIVSRQREYLADASAVQFTRNKDSIAGALKKIGGLSAGSYIENASAPEYSHAYFANGISSFWQSLFATHPPLEKRIKQIDPAWNGKFILPTPEQTSEQETTDTTSSHTTTENIVGAVVSATILSSVEQAITQAGTVSENNIDYVHNILASLPEIVRNASNNAYSARAVIYALLIQDQADQNKVWALLKTYADNNMPELTQRLMTDISQLDIKLKLPLIELAIIALRELSKKQYLQFRHTIENIISSDKTVDLNEWIIQRLVLQQLDEHFSLRKPARTKYAILGNVKQEAEILLSTLAYTEHINIDNAVRAFNAGKKEIGAAAFNIIKRSELSANKLNSAVDKLMQLKPLLKPRIIKACAAIILSDGKATDKGIEIFRTIAISLDCPMPPLSK